MPMFHPADIAILLFLFLGGMVSILAKKLTAAAGVTAIVVGILIYKGSGFTSLAALATFFLLATMSTAHKKALKARIEQRTVHQQKRDTGQVLANGGIPALLGLLGLLFPDWQKTTDIMIAGALSAATADTIASELGMIYGRVSVNILTFKREHKGLNGVVSLEGFLLGAAGSLAIGIIYATGSRSVVTIPVVVIAGTIGNIVDSYLGATVERRKLMTNNMVNIANTLAGALAAFLAMTWIQ